MLLLLLMICSGCAHTGQVKTESIEVEQERAYIYLQITVPDYHFPTRVEIMAKIGECQERTGEACYANLVFSYTYSDWMYREIRERLETYYDMAPTFLEMEINDRA